MEMPSSCRLLLLTRKPLALRLLRLSAEPVLVLKMTPGGQGGQRREAATVDGDVLNGGALNGVGTFGAFGLNLSGAGDDGDSFRGSRRPRR